MFKAGDIVELLPGEDIGRIAARPGATAVVVNASDTCNWSSRFRSSPTVHIKWCRDHKSGLQGDGWYFAKAFKLRADPNSIEVQIMDYCHRELSL